MRNSIRLKDADRNHVRLLAEGIYGDQIDTDKQLDTFLKLLSKELIPGERALLIYKHGLEKGTTAKGLFEAAEVFGTTKEMVRQAENRALFKLKSPILRDKVVGVKSQISTLTLDTKIVDCDLLTSSINLLKSSKIKTIKDLLNMRLEDFSKIKGLDKAVMIDVQTFIRDINL